MKKFTSIVFILLFQTALFAQYDCEQIIISNNQEDSIVSIIASPSANGLIVNTDVDFEWQQIVFTAWHSRNATIGSVDVKYYTDAGGVPGELIAEEMQIIPTFVTAINHFNKYCTSEVVLNIPPFTFEGQKEQEGQATSYWISIIGTINGPGEFYWELTSATNVGHLEVKYNDSAWDDAYGGYSGFDGAASWTGLCSAIDSTCSDPLTLIIDELTDRSVDLIWTTGADENLDIEWDVTGFTPTGTPSINDTPENPYTLTGLTASTDYDLYVRKDCGSNNIETSNWVGPFRLTTAAQLSTDAEFTTYTIQGQDDSYIRAVNDSKDVKVHPNPKQGIFNLLINLSNIERVSLEIINAKVQVVSNFTNVNTNSPQSIDLSDLARGVYYIKVYTGNEFIINKVNILN